MYRTASYENRHNAPPSLGSAFRRQTNVVYAVVLRTLRTRFFGHSLGYLLAVGMPISHILILITIFSIGGRAPPYGDSTILFIATGSIPFMAFSYLARFLMVDLASNKPLLLLPEVKFMDLIIGGLVLEVLSAYSVVIFMVSLGWYVDIPVIPNDVTEAFLALLVAVLLGAGMGVLNSVIMMVFPMWMTGYTLINVAMWASSGVMFIPSAVPDPFRTWLSYNPALQVVEWMRAAYYPGYGELVLDKNYAIGFAVVTLALGLVLARLINGYVLSAR